VDNYFFDSSGLIKRFRNETGSSWVIQTHRPSNKHIIHIAQTSLVEVTAALTRRMNNPQFYPNYIKGIKRFERDALGRYSIFRLTDSVFSSAVNITKNHRLRGYDAVQLASAIEIEKELLSLNLSSLIFVSADNELNSAAQAEGLQIENPNNYP
jgi:uncharacterized protein